MSNKVKLLFVDDDPQSIIILRSLFDQKYTVLTASTGDAALEIIQREQIHVIVSDQIMPGLLGHELLRKVAQLSPYTMRVLLTAHTDMPALTQSINEGEVFRFVIKPWRVAELRDIVESAVEIAEETRLAMPIVERRTSAAVAKVSDVGILLLDEDEEVQAAFKKEYANLYPLYFANDVAQALDTLVTNDVGVLVADPSTNSTDIVDFILLLKEQFPVISTIIQTAMSDPSTAVKLINHGQVLRYLHKPVSMSLMTRSIVKALQKFQNTQHSPVLLQRHQVKAPKEIHESDVADLVDASLRKMGK